jgi:Fe(3+) dicitrate transport protein
MRPVGNLNIIIFVFSILCVGPAFGQTVRGRVTDPAGAAISGAQVQVVDTLQVVFTSANGKFAIQRVTAGRMTVRATSAHFEAVQRLVDVPESGEVEIDLQFKALRAAVTSMEVVGESAEALLETPGSVFMLERREIRESHAMDANEVLRRVPGVQVQEQSGPVGMRLNIGIRGLNPDRSRSVLMLEDGLPVAIAPYGEPEMYYSPQIDRMSHVEVVKGSGQIIYGPQTVGGVINFVTPDPPARLHGNFDIQGGQRGFFSGYGSIGSSSEDQKVGWLINYLHKRGDGWRNFFFDLDDLQTKFILKPSDAHTFTLKAGYYDENSNSTYLGLTTPMWLADPNQNPVATDFLKVRRFNGSLSHSVAVSPAMIWSSSLFGYSTVRDWARANFDRADQGRPYLGVFGDPSIPGGAIFLRDNSLNRNRQFGVYGAQTGISTQKGWFGMRHTVDAGVRYVAERMDDQQVEGTTVDARTGALRDDEDRYGRAFSAFVQDRIFLTSRLTLTPGVRLEHYGFERHILRTPVGGVATNVDRRTGSAVTKVIPGLGASYQVNNMLAVFGGVHRGFAPPRVKDAITTAGVDLELDAELSWNYEAGVRLLANRAVRGELTFFRLDFDNQIIPGAQSGGAVTTLVNAGQTLHQGMESSLRVDWSSLFRWSWLFYTDVRHMHLPMAKFTRDALFLGNRLPYAPRQTFAFLMGLRQRQGFGMQLDSAYVASQFADNRQTVVSSADGTVGLVPAYTVWNVNADYEIARERVSMRPYVAVKNLTDRRYIASRAPQGIQPGMFRQLNIGIRFSF